MDIPNHGLVSGEWDLRGREPAYFGNIDFKNKTVLEIGPASGHLCFAMEKLGADMTIYDLSVEQKWDIVPYEDGKYKEHISDHQEHIQKLNNGFWFAHKAFQSKAKAVYGTVYELPESVGQFDICTFGAVLLHLRDPFLAMERVAAHAKESMVVTEFAPGLKGWFMMLLGRLAGSRLVRFLPNAKKNDPFATWWSLSPEFVSEVLNILGFPYTEITYHKQIFLKKETKLFTVVGHRTKP